MEVAYYCSTILIQYYYCTLDVYAVSRVAVWRQRRRQVGRLSVAVPGRGVVSCAWSGACASDHGYAARQPHRGRQLWDRAESTAQAPARCAGRPLQADQVHAPGDPRHVPGIQTGRKRKRPGRPAGSTTASLSRVDPLSIHHHYQLSGNLTKINQGMVLFLHRR